MSHTTTLRTLIQAPDLLVMPGIFDGFSARLVEQTGFRGRVYFWRRVKRDPPGL